MTDIKIKLCDKPIVIDDWRLDETYEGVYSKGAREKSAYFSPAAAEKNCLKRNFRYLFKLSRHWCPWQFWGEIIAYRLGLITGVEVPPAHVGLSDNYSRGKTTYGALIEWFYDDKKDIYVDGGQYMAQFIEDFDRQKGTQHNFMTITELKDYQGSGFREHWAGVFTLDCLTGNTDRHQDNWGLVFKGARARFLTGAGCFSPAFDNGTALSYEVLEDNIDKCREEKRLEKYLNDPSRARHHMKWSLDENEKLNFYDFMQKFILEFPDTKSIISKHLNFGRSQVEDVIRPLVTVISDDTYCLSSKRLDFITELIFRRKELLEKALNI